MCLSIPAKVVSITGNRAEVDIRGIKSHATLDLLEGVKPGDYVLVHTGYAIQKYDPEDAQKTLDLYDEMLNP